MSQWDAPRRCEWWMRRSVGVGGRVGSVAGWDEGESLLKW